MLTIGVQHGSQTIAHRVGSYKHKHFGVLGNTTGHSNFIGPDQ